MSETITDERLAQLVDTLSADNEVAAEALAFETHRARTAETRLVAENKALRASLAVAVKAKAVEEQRAKDWRAAAEEAGRHRDAAVKAKEEAERERDIYAGLLDNSRTIGDSLRSQLAQAREALKHIECVAEEERPPRDLEESARDLGRILTAARAALSPPSSGSGVDSRACGPCLDGDHERCAGAHCLCPHARVAYMLGSSPGSGVEREEETDEGVTLSQDPWMFAPTDGGGKR